MSSEGAPPELDAVEVLTAVMEALKDDLAGGPEIPDADMPREALTGTAVIRATDAGTLGGLPVAKEAYRRLGVRMRPLKEEGSAIAADERVAGVGGPLPAPPPPPPPRPPPLQRPSAAAPPARGAGPA